MHVINTRVHEHTQAVEKLKVRARYIAAGKAGLAWGTQAVKD
jgi:hypothetical protein